MAKKSFLSKIRTKLREWVRGDTVKPTKVAAPTPRGKTEALSTRTNRAADRRALIETVKGSDKVKPQETYKEKNNPYKANVESFKSLTESLKKDVPDPKEAKRKEAQDKAKANAEKREKALKSYNKATSNRYDVKGATNEAEKLKRRQAQKSQAFDVEAANWETKAHPIITSAARGATSGASFGASDLIAAKGTKGKAREAEEYYQKNKNKYAEFGGELAGSLASFGLTSGAAGKVGGKAIAKAMPNAAERLAESGIVKGVAKRSATKAVEKGLVNEATDELVKQIGKNKAAKVVEYLGEDIVQNLTTGALYDINRASAEYEVGSKDWWKEVGRSAALNAVITTGIAGGKTLWSGKGLAKAAADEIYAGRKLIQNADAANRAFADAPINDRVNINDLVADRTAKKRAKDIVFDRANQADEALNRLPIPESENVRIKALGWANNANEGARKEAYDSVVRGAERSANNIGDGASVNINRIVDARQGVIDSAEAQARRNIRLDQVKAELDNYARIINDPLTPNGAKQEAMTAWDALIAERNDLMRGTDEYINGLIRKDPRYAAYARYEELERQFDELTDAVDINNPDPRLVQQIDEITAEMEQIRKANGGDYFDTTRQRVADDILTDLSNQTREDSRRAMLNELDALNDAKNLEPEDVAPIKGTPIEEVKAEKPKGRKGTKKTPPTREEKIANSDGLDNYNQRNAKLDELRQTADEHADAIRAELAGSKSAKGTKGTKPAADTLPKQQTKNVDDFAGVKDDVSDMGFNAKNEEAYQAGKKVEAEANKADTGKTAWDKKKDAAYAESGTGLNTDNVEHLNAGEAQKFFDAEYRTTNEHTKRGYSTIAVTGDKGFAGFAHKILKEGQTVIDVYHDKENLAKGAQRVMERADKGEIGSMIKEFKKFASGEMSLNTKELRDQLYDIIAAVDFANANKNEDWAADLYVAACEAGAEQTSVGGLSLRMWKEMAMSSPAHRAKAVRQQILDMFNRSAGMRKALGKGKGNKITDAELNDILKKNPALEKVLDELNKMDASTSVDELNEVASKALLHARKAMPMTALDQLTQWRYVAMLSSPKTHIRNVTSNIYSATLGQLRDAIASTTEDNIIKGTGKYGKKFKAAVAEGKIDESNYHKSAGGLSWKAFKDSHTGTKAGFSLDRLNSKLERAKLELEATPKTEKNASKIVKLQDRIKDIESKIPAAQKEFDDAVAKLERGSAKRAHESWRSMGKDELVANIEKFEHRQYNGTASKGLFKMNDKMSNFIGSALETSDALSLERIYREKFDKILTANGWDELSKLAANGDESAKKAIKSLEEYAAQEASYTAALDTYRNYNALSTAMNRFITDSLFNYDAPLWKKFVGAGLHAVMPFTKVPVNLLKRGIDYSPVGLMTAKRNLTRAIESGNITEINRACERLAEGRIGTGILMLGAGLGFADPDGDLITGRLHDTDYLDKKKKDAGYQNYSVTLGDKNFTLDWATPTASSLFTGVEFGRILRNTFDKIASDEGLQFDFWKAFDVPMILASTTLEPTMQLGVFQGINDTLESVVKSDNYDNSGTNINPALKIIGSIAGNYVNSQISPAVLSSLSRAFAPYDYFVTGDTNAEYAFNQQLAKVPFLSARTLGAKTNVWGQIKNEKQGAGDYAKSLAKNMLSPANINKITWDETDDWAADFYKQTGYEDVFPKNNYKSEIEIGRIKGDHPIKMTNKEMAEYNVQRGRSGSDAMRDALNTVVFNRYDKDEKGHRTIPHADNITPEEVERLCKEYEGKGIKEVVDYIRKTPQFQKATVAEQKQIIDAIYGTKSGNGDESKGAKRSAERYIAEKKGMSADEYDYYNETPLKVQEALKPFIEEGKITVETALAFTRGAGKTYYTTDERGEKGGTVATHYNKKEMMEYLANAGLSYEEAEILYNAYKNANAKSFEGIDLSSSSGKKGYYGGRRRYRSGRSSRKSSGSKAKTPTVNKSAFKADKQTYKSLAESLPKKSSSSSGAKYSTASVTKAPTVNYKSSSKTATTKVKPPTVKFKKYEV